MSARLKLTVTSPPQTFTEPFGVSEAKSWNEIPDTDSTRDFDLATCVTAAREVAELRQGRDLVRKQYDLHMDWIPCRIETRDNLSSVDLFTYRQSDGQTITMVQNTDFIVDTVQNLVLPPYGVSFPSFTPWPSSAVLLRYTVAPPTPDQQVLMGMRFLISMWFNNRIPVSDMDSSIEQYPFCLALLDHGRVESV